METKQELEAYLAKTKVDEVLRAAMTECLARKPDDPALYLLKWFIQQNAHRTSEESAVGSKSSAEAGGDGMHVVLVTPTAQQQAYIARKRLHVIFLELLDQIIKEEPENPLSFLALAAHNLHKAPPESLRQ